MICRQVAPNKSLQTDKGKLSCPLLAQGPRQLAFEAELVRWAAKDAERLGTSDASARGVGQLEEPKYRNPAPRPGLED